MDSEKFQEVYDGLPTKLKLMYGLQIIDNDIYAFKPATVGFSIEGLREVEIRDVSVTFRNKLGCMTLFKNVEQQLVTFYEFKRE